MNFEKDERQEIEPPSLTAWIGNVLFIMNILIGAIGSVMIYRYGKIARDTFEDFEVELTTATEMALSPIIVFILPLMTLISFVIYLSPISLRSKIAGQSMTLLAMLINAAIFVLATVPAMFKLIESLK